MSPLPVTFPIAFVRGALTRLQARGEDCDTFLARAGIEAELLTQPGARVLPDQLVTLFRVLIEQCGDEFLGYLSRPMKKGCFAMLARSALSAPEFGTAIRRAIRMFHLLQDDLLIEVLHQGERIGIALRFANPAVERHSFVHEYALRVFWRLLMWLTGDRLAVARFDFAFETPPYAGNDGNMFPAETRFGEPQTAFWFDAAWLQQPVRQSEAALRTIDTSLNLVIPEHNGEIISARVRKHLQLTQPAWPDRAATADALNMSVATLQRRLALEGTTFQALKDALRRDTAIARLSTSAVPLNVLAQELGFADSATFQRAFKHWTGSAPGAYRRSLS